ncbi:MAG: hypothetical protein ACYC35_09080 [Pirellulales bacterium]
MAGEHGATTRTRESEDLSQYEPWEPTVDEAELRRREQSSERRYTTAEMLDRLENL